MNRRLLVILMSAFAISLVCCYLVYRVVGKRVTTVLPPQRTTAVIAAKTDIKLGSVLRDIDLTTIDIAGSVPKGLILKRSDAIGRGVVSDLYQGEPIAQSRLAAEGSGGGMAATIPQGMRACAVRVDEVVGVAGFVIPGMRVDVLIAGNPLRPQIANDGPVVQTLLQNIQVLSAGTDIQKDAEGKPQHVQVVNLLVTPEQAEILSLASSHTRIQLVLRNPLDMQIGHPPGTALANLFVDEKANRPKHAAGSKDAATPPRHVYLVEVFNGTARTEQKFVSAEGRE